MPALAFAALDAFGQDAQPRRILNLEDVRVIGVSNGDTITVRGFGGQERRIRLAGIDAPEMKQPFGQAAKTELSNILSEGFVSLHVVGRNRLRREIAWVFVGPQQAPVNVEMVRRGCAWQYLHYERSKPLQDAEQEARTARRGLWQDLDTASKPIPPWKWRKRSTRTG